MKPLYEPHPYAGLAPICKICFQNREHFLHLASQEISQVIPVKRDLLDQAITLQSIPAFQHPALPVSYDLVTTENKPSAHTHICQSCGKIEVHLDREECLWNSLIICNSCQERNDRLITEMPGQILNQAILESEKSSSPVSIVLCPGHKCEKCDDTWHHSYRCNKASDGVKTLCPTCAGVMSQTGADSIRHSAIAEIAKNQNGRLTGEDTVKIGVDEENFVVLNLWKDENGKDRPDGNERLTAHIAALELEMETLKIRLSKDHSLGAARRTKEMEKLTPEELTEYKKQASKPTAKKEKKVKDLSEEEKKKAWSASLKSMTDMILASNKKLTKEQAQAKAEKFMESQANFVKRDEVDGVV